MSTTNTIHRKAYNQLSSIYEYLVSRKQDGNTWFTIRSASSLLGFVGCAISAPIARRFTHTYSQTTWRRDQPASVD